MWFTRSKKCKAKLVQSGNFESEKEADDPASSRRLSRELGLNGENIHPMTQNTEHLCSTCGGNRGSVAVKLPRAHTDSADEEEEEEEEGILQEGYIGKAKGMKQILWERGWFVEGMSTADHVAPEMNLEKVLSAQEDFEHERPALQHLVESRGHTLLLSPKYHPEIAGVGIEYSWGMSKMRFRRQINDEIPTHLHRNMVASTCPTTILTLTRIRRFARRTRDYCREYLALATGGEIESKNMIEKMKKNCKAHRNILDMEPSFIESLI